MQTNKTVPLQGRHELKHSLNYMDYVQLQGRLRHFLQLDAHAVKSGEYAVRSLYFDTPGDKALKEKLDGINRREKFRIRSYDGDTSFLRLEKKSKAHGLCYKQAQRITREEVARLLAGDHLWMREKNESLFIELYSKMQSQQLRPKTIVEYIREPFVFPPGNVRVTLDREICSGIRSTDFLQADTPLVKAGDELVVLEVKYDAFLPQIVADLIRLESRHAAACSKYALCRIYG